MLIIIKSYDSCDVKITYESSINIVNVKNVNTTYINFSWNDDIIKCPNQCWKGIETQMLFNTDINSIEVSIILKIS